MRILHFDTLNNASVYWAKHLQRHSRFYIWVSTVDLENEEVIRNALKTNPTHMVFGGGFYAAKKLVLNFLAEYTKKYKPNVFTYYGDAYLTPVSLGFTVDVHRKGIAKITFCSSIDGVEKLISMGANSVEFSPHPVDTDIFRPWNLPKIYDWNFTGNHQPERHKTLDIARSAGLNYVIRGLGHEPCSYMSSYEESAIIYNQSKITLTITAPQFHNLRQYFSDRLGMGMCAGSFSLTNYQPDLEVLFKRGYHLDWYTNDEEMFDKLKWYADHDTEREKIAKQGYELAIKMFDMSQMLKDFLEKSKW